MSLDLKDATVEFKRIYELVRFRLPTKSPQNIYKSRGAFYPSISLVNQLDVKAVCSCDYRGFWISIRIPKLSCVIAFSDPRTFGPEAVPESVLLALRKIIINMI